MQYNSSATTIRRILISNDLRFGKSKTSIRISESAICSEQWRLLVVKAGSDAATTLTK